MMEIFGGIISDCRWRVINNLLSQCRSADAVARADRALRDRAAELCAALDGIWVQHMITGGLELLVTAYRDPHNSASWWAAELAAA